MEVKESNAMYLARPRYKQTEVGTIPEAWEIASLSSVSKRHLQNGLFFQPSLKGSGVKIINVGDLYAGVPIDSDSLELFNATNEERERFKVEDGDLFFTRSSVVASGIAHCNIYRSRKPESVVFDSHVIRLRPDIDKVVPSYLFRFCVASIARRYLVSHAKTATMTTIDQGVLGKCPVLLPPYKEQETIAEALSDADALIESLEQLLAKKRQLKQGAMQELLTGKKRLPRFSEKWGVKALGELFTFSGGLSASRDQLSTEGHCYLHYGDIHLSSKSFIDVRAEFQDIPKLKVPLNKIAAKALLADGDVVFVDASEDDEGASKHVVVVNPNGTPFISGLHTIVAKTTDGELEKRYRRYCFQTRGVKAQFLFFAVGTKVSGISKTNIAKITMPVPPLAEQAAIAEILSDMDTEVDALALRLSRARLLKKGMMQELLTGRVRLV